MFRSLVDFNNISNCSGLDEKPGTAHPPSQLKLTADGRPKLMHDELFIRSIKKKTPAPVSVQPSSGECQTPQVKGVAKRNILGTRGPTMSPFMKVLNPSVLRGCFSFSGCSRILKN